MGGGCVVCVQPGWGLEGWGISVWGAGWCPSSTVTALGVCPGLTRHAWFVCVVRRAA